MKLALKLVSIAVAGVALVLTVDTFISIRREIALFDADARHDSRLLGDTVKAVLTEVFDSKGQKRVLELIHDIDQDEPDVHIRWVWLDATDRSDFRPQVNLNKIETALHGNNVILEDRNATGQRCLFNYVPMTSEGHRLGALELSEPLDRLELQHQALAVRKVIIMVGLIVFSGFTIVILGTLWVGRPLTRLIEKVRQVGQGNLAEPLQVRSKDEFNELAIALNTMCDQLAESQEKIQRENAARIQVLEQLRRADRLATVGNLASGVAHELGTPLNVISVKAKQIAEQQLSEEEIPESARIIRAQADKVTAIVRHLLDFARYHPLKKQLVDLRPEVTRVVQLLTPLARKRGITLMLDMEKEPLPVQVDPGQIEQVATNLILNAIQATPAGGRVDIWLGAELPRAIVGQRRMRADVEYACLSIEDHGEGISEKDQPHVFEPFFTTKDVGEGTGLGLSISHGIVEEHGGWIECESKQGQGSRFSVFLPMTKGATILNNHQQKSRVSET